MKKILSVAILSLLTCNFVYGVDFNSIKQKAINVTANHTGIPLTSNSKQILSENKVKEFINTPEFELRQHVALIQQDKDVYDNDKTADTLYNRLLTIQKKYEKLSLDIPDVEYAKSAKKLFDVIANYTPDNCPTPDEFDKMKIIIKDSDFDRLDKDLIEIINFLNVY